MTKKIILDTNFLLIPAQFKVDIFSEIVRIADFSYELFIIDKTLDELKKITETQKVKDRFAANLALQLLKAKNVKRILGDEAMLIICLINSIWFLTALGLNRAGNPAVLADAPAFGFEPAVMVGGVESERGNARGLIFRRVEAGEMLADDLVGGIALEPLRTRIPADHHAVGIQHVDGIVGNALNQQFEAVARFMVGGGNHHVPESGASGCCTFAFGKTALEHITLQQARHRHQSAEVQHILFS